MALKHLLCKKCGQPMEMVYEIVYGYDTYGYEDGGYLNIDTEEETEPYAVKCKNRRCEAFGKEIKPTEEMVDEFESNF